MNKKIIRNARIITMNERLDILPNGNILIENGKISAITTQSLEDTDAEITDAEGMFLLPGLINTHTHLPMTMLRGFADDLPLQEWLQQKVFPNEARLKGEDTYWLAILGIMEYLTSGITSNFDMYIMQDYHINAYVDTGFRTVFTSGLNNFTDSLEVLEENYLRINGLSDLTSYVPGFHAEYTTSRPLLEGVAKIADKYHAPVWTHNSETEREVAECKARWGMTPMQFTESLGLYEHGGGGYHCVWLEEKDIEILKKHHMSVVTNPGSNTKLASGICPVKRLLDEGINLAIGTDGPASNNCLDMFREMFLVTGLSKLLEKDASSMDAVEVLKMATVNGAKAMRLNRADVLAKGKYADLIMIDLHQPNMHPIHNIPKNLVYSGSKSNVCMTMIGGKILYRNGEFNVGENPERIYTKCEKIVKRLLTE